MPTYSVSLLFMEPRSISNLWGLGKRKTLLDVKQVDAENKEEAFDVVYNKTKGQYWFKDQKIEQSMNLEMKVIKEIWDFTVTKTQEEILSAISDLPNKQEIMDRLELYSFNNGFEERLQKAGKKFRNANRKNK